MVMWSMVMLAVVLGLVVLVVVIAGVVVVAVRAKAVAWKPPERSGPPTLLRAFSSADTPLAANATWQGGELEIRAGQAGTVRLFEARLSEPEQCVLLYRFRIKTDALKAPVYAEMWCRIPAKGEFFSRGLDQKVSEAHDWRTIEIPFYLEEGQRADLVKLNLVFEGPGVVRLSEIEILSAPVKPRLQAA